MKLGSCSLAGGRDGLSDPWVSQGSPGYFRVFRAETPQSQEWLNPLSGNDFCPPDRACGDRSYGLLWKSTSAENMTTGAVYFREGERGDERGGDSRRVDGRAAGIGTSDRPEAGRCLGIPRVLGDISGSFGSPWHEFKRIELRRTRSHP